MTTPILYSFRRCPYAMRARLAISSSGEVVRLREVALRDKPKEMVAASPKATVPVLCLPQSDVLEESLDIMLWALRKSDPEQLLGADDATLAEMKDLVSENDGPFKVHLDRYKYHSRYDDADPVFHRAEGSAFLQRLNDRLTSSDYLFGDKVRLADLAIFPFVRQFRITDPDWFDAQSFQRVRQWLERLTSSERFADVMQKYKPWKPGDPEIFFGGHH